MTQVLKSLRGRLGLTQKELAAELGVTSSTYSKWERTEEHAPPWLERYLRMKSDLEAPGFLLSGYNATIKDPLHKKILEALNAKVDSTDFENCAASLLRRSGLRVVLVGGSSDYGFDGEVEDDDAEPSPLIVTTETNILQNFKRNLEKVSSYTTSRRVHLATTKTVRESTRIKIREFARKHSFTIGGIYDQHWFSEQLYTNSDWRIKLFNIPGYPQSLSSFSRSSRPIFSDTIVGRENELSTLQQSKGDCLLVGPPGSGKTFIFYHLVNESGALFLCGGDKDRIADEIRDKQPDIILYDDAHSDTELLQTLYHIRRTINANFRIVASCWSIEKFVSDIQQILQIDNQDTILLQPLSGRQIFEIVVAQGVYARQIQAVIGQQAAGMPGLAVSLCQLHTRSSANLTDLVSGEALMKELIPRLVEHIEGETKPLLAAIAVGGDFGMPLKAVANHLSMSETSLMGRLQDLAYAGIIFTHGENIVVRPSPLAYALVRSVFFSTTVKNDTYFALFRQASSKRCALKVLICIHAFGTQVRQHIEFIIKQYKDQMTNLDLIHFASLGEHEADFVIKEFPERYLETARGFLRVNPKRFLPQYFDHVIEESENFNGSFSQMQDVLYAWVTERSQEDPEAISRRKALVETTVNWMKSKTNIGKEAARVANFALTEAFKGSWEGTTPSPILDEIWYYSAVPNIEQTNELQRLWDDAVDYLCESANISEMWIDTIDLIRQWCHANVERTPDEDTLYKRKEFATQIRNDLAKRFASSPGLLMEIERFDQKLFECFEVDIDSEFEILFSSPIDCQEEATLKKIQQLAHKYLALGPEVTAELVVNFDAEASNAGLHDRRLAYEFCQLIVDEVEDSNEWLIAFLEAECPGNLLKSFIGKSFALRPKHTVKLLARHNKDEKYLFELLDWSKRNKEIFQQYQSLLLDYISNNLSVLDEISLGTDTDVNVLLELLNSDRQRISYNVALAYYQETGRPPPSLCVKRWKAAISLGKLHWRRDANRDNFLVQIFTEDHEFGMQWLEGQYQLEIGRRTNHPKHLSVKVIKLLSERERLTLLSKVNFEHLSDEEIVACIGSSQEIYKVFLMLDISSRKKLAPLAEPGRDYWRTLLLIALEHKVTTSECIAEYVASKPRFNGNVMFREVCEQKLTYCRRYFEDEDRRVAEVAELTARNLNALIEEDELSTPY